jgi:hypothetical protein
MTEGTRAMDRMPLNTVSIPAPVNSCVVGAVVATLSMLGQHYGMMSPSSPLLHGAAGFAGSFSVSLLRSR